MLYLAEHGFTTYLFEGPGQGGVMWVQGKHFTHEWERPVEANKDHFIPYTMVGEEINALKNVRSLTFRLFTDKEDACNHCNCGNVKLTFDTFMNWIMQMKEGGR